jgi:large subunit ribosomal protein L3
MELLSVTKENFDKVTAAAVADKHYCIAPTHYWENKQGEIAGHMGDRQVTKQSLKVVKIDEQSNIVLVKGGVPGAVNGNLIIMPAVKKK